MPIDWDEELKGGEKPKIDWDSELAPVPNADNSTAQANKLLPKGARVGAAPDQTFFTPQGKGSQLPAEEGKLKRAATAAGASGAFEVQGPSSEGKAINPEEGQEIASQGGPDVGDVLQRSAGNLIDPEAWKAAGQGAVSDLKEGGKQFVHLITDPIKRHLQGDTAGAMGEGSQTLPQAGALIEGLTKPIPDIAKGAVRGAAHVGVAAEPFLDNELAGIISPRLPHAGKVIGAVGRATLRNVKPGSYSRQPAVDPFTFQRTDAAPQEGQGAWGQPVPPEATGENAQADETVKGFEEHKPEPLIQTEQQPTRRDFLKTAGKAAAGTALSKVVPEGATPGVEEPELSLADAGMDAGPGMLDELVQHFADSGVFEDRLEYSPEDFQKSYGLSPDEAQELYSKVQAYDGPFAPPEAEEGGIEAEEEEPVAEEGKTPPATAGEEKSDDEKLKDFWDSSSKTGKPGENFTPDELAEFKNRNGIKPLIDTGKDWEEKGIQEGMRQDLERHGDFAQGSKGLRTKWPRGEQPWRGSVNFEENPDIHELDALLNPEDIKGTGGPGAMRRIPPEWEDEANSRLDKAIDQWKAQHPDREPPQDLVERWAQMIEDNFKEGKPLINTGESLKSMVSRINEVTPPENKVIMRGPIRDENGRPWSSIEDERNITWGNEEQLPPLTKKSKPEIIRGTGPRGNPETINPKNRRSTFLSHLSDEVEQASHEISGRDFGFRGPKTPDDWERVETEAENTVLERHKADFDKWMKAPFSASKSKGATRKITEEAGVNASDEQLKADMQNQRDQMGDQLRWLVENFGDDRVLLNTLKGLSPQASEIVNGIMEEINGRSSQEAQAATPGRAGSGEAGVRESSGEGVRASEGSSQKTRPLIDTLDDAGVRQELDRRVNPEEEVPGELDALLNPDDIKGTGGPGAMKARPEDWDRLINTETDADRWNKGTPQRGPKIKPPVEDLFTPESGGPEGIDREVKPHEMPRSMNVAHESNRWNEGIPKELEGEDWIKQFEDSGEMPKDTNEFLGVFIDDFIDENGREPNAKELEEIEKLAHDSYSKEFGHVVGPVDKHLIDHATEMEKNHRLDEAYRQAHEFPQNEHQWTDSHREMLRQALSGELGRTRLIDTLDDQGVKQEIEERMNRQEEIPGEVDAMLNPDDVKGTGGPGAMRGRPKFPEGTAKHKIVTSRFTESELKQIKQLAKKEGMNLTDWVRSKLLKK